MMVKHNIADFLSSRGYLVDVSNKVILAKDVVGARRALENDRDGFLFNALNAYGGVIISIQRRNYAWAIVKAYYCVFYLMRVKLAENNHALIYGVKEKPQTPFSLYVAAGERFQKRKGNTHEVILKLFKDNFSHHYMLSNAIAGKFPLEWFKSVREAMNYRLTPVTDPDPPFDFVPIHENIRGWLMTYINDQTGSYTFSPEHAYLAYASRFLFMIIDDYLNDGHTCRFITNRNIEYFRKNICDQKGPLGFIVDRISEICRL
jgi:hypothetical protein